MGQPWNIESGLIFLENLFKAKLYNMHQKKDLEMESLLDTMIYKFMIATG